MLGVNSAINCVEDPSWGECLDAVVSIALDVSMVGIEAHGAELAGKTVLEDGGTEVVQRWMSNAELDATRDTGLVRGGRDGTHYASDASNSDPLRARQRLSSHRHRR
jgi:hypothetical protein